MSNANRDYAIVYDVKNSTLVLSRPLIFYLTDKNTSNIFVKLVKRVIVGEGIDQYTDIENASSYVLTMRVIKPDDEVKSIIATQHESESIFQFDLTEDFKDVPGKYICELTISNIVNGRQEFTTSDPFNYEVKRSILSNVKNIIEGKDTTVEKLLNDLDATKAELSSQIKEIENTTISILSNNIVIDKSITFVKFKEIIAKANANKTTIYLQNCEIDITDNLNINCNIKGNNAIFNLSHSKNIIIDSCKIDSIIFEGGNNNSGSIILYGSNIIFENNVIRNFKAAEGLSTKALWVRECNNVIIKNNIFDGFSPSAINENLGDEIGTCRAIHVDGGNDINICNNKFYNIKEYDDSDYIHIYNTTNVSNEFPFTDLGFYYNKSRVNIYDNYFLNPTKSAIKIQSSGVCVYNNKFEVDDNIKNIFVIRVKGSKNTKIKNNSISMGAGEYYTPLLLENCFDIEVKQNDISMLSTNITNYKYSVSCQKCKKIYFLNNIISSNEKLATFFTSCEELNIEDFISYKQSVEIIGTQDVKINNINFLGELLDSNYISHVKLENNNNIIISNCIFNRANRYIWLTGSTSNNNVSITNCKLSSQELTNSIFLAVYDETSTLDNLYLSNVPQLLNDKPINFGTTSSRPNVFCKISRGHMYYDLTLGKYVMFDGSDWI